MDGRYWYDRKCGAWGIEGGPALGILLPNLNLGGSLKANASNGNTGVYINGRQLHRVDLMALQSLTGPIARGRYWVDAMGNAGLEGQRAIVNLMVLHKQKTRTQHLLQELLHRHRCRKFRRHVIRDGKRLERDHQLIQMNNTSNTNTPNIRRALPREAEFLTDLAMRSKAHWGYPDSFIEECRAELTLTPEWIASHPVFVMDETGTVTGFYSLETIDEKNR